MTDTSPTAEVQRLFKKRTAKNSTIRKRPATPPPAESDSSDYASSEDEDGRQIKRRRKTVGVTTKSSTVLEKDIDDLEATKYAADRLGRIESTNDATKQSNWYDESGKDALSAKTLLGTTRAKPNTAGEVDNDGKYKGAANYQSFIQKNPNAPNRQMFAKTTSRQASAFGDSCKFLHAREDYKQGWELDKDWEIGTKDKKLVAGAKKAQNDENSDDDDAVLEGIPFACIICKNPYTNPIITKCGHYFCEKCALQRYKKNPSCAACGAGTGGVFNNAKGLSKILDKKREQAKNRREKAIANGEEVDEESDKD